MKKTVYTQPTLDIEYVVVESGIAASPFGEAGQPGQGSGFIDFGNGEDDMYL